ncbi:hypothetical protein [Flavobacterium crassostreae]|uniref:Uncharacterized protein n=1 Tax=Flavobacterium crassostreae TaxID=1763534 RepID=A0A1B9E7P5_9FLAO|nr:hypothetical protein [Flavobacterium crassostreae]OCB77974.1 hypothetical protein LPBF_03230 [Flavobacterium crassostreae]
MKFIYTFSFLIISIISFAQKRDIPAEIILIDGDTINTEISVGVNLFNKDFINELSIIKSVKLVHDINGKTKILAKEIKKISFTDFKNSQRVFVADNKKLREMIYENIVKCYIYYMANPYDGSKVAQFEFYDEDGKKARNLKKAVKEKPEILDIIKNSKELNYATIQFILKKYEDDYLIKK